MTDAQSDGLADVVSIVRQSQGGEDSISLEVQRERVRELAEELGDPDPEIIDLGVHTGFSRFVKGDEGQTLDAEPRIQALEKGLQNGDWDYLTAYDDTRICRDQYFWVIWHSAMKGGVELEFVEPIPDNRLTFAVQRVVESEVKRKEIAKVREAKERRAEQGMHDGKAPFGLQYDEASEYLVKDPDEWDQLVTIFTMVEDDRYSYSDIVDEVDGIASAGTITKIRSRRETYEAHGLEIKSVEDAVDA